MISAHLKPWLYFFGTLCLQWVTLGVAVRAQMAEFIWFDWSVLIAGTLGNSLLALLAYRDPARKDNA